MLNFIGYVANESLTVTKESLLHHPSLVWEWVDHEPNNFSNWNVYLGGGEPESHTFEHCVAYYSVNHYAWASVFCTNQGFYGCEMKDNSKT